LRVDTNILFFGRSIAKPAGGDFRDFCKIRLWRNGGSHGGEEREVSATKWPVSKGVGLRGMKAKCNRST
jgi:hypothetical protein